LCTEGVTLLPTTPSDVLVDTINTMLHDPLTTLQSFKFFIINTLSTANDDDEPEEDWIAILKSKSTRMKTSSVITDKTTPM